MAEDRNFDDFIHLATKIVAVTNNYADHVKEIGYSPTERGGQTTVFMKPISAFITQGQSILFPAGCTALNHEVELAVIIGRLACGVSEADALQYVAGYTIALDMTIKNQLIEEEENPKVDGAPDGPDRNLDPMLFMSPGLPWDISKGFDTSCPVGPFIRRERVADPNDQQLWLKVNGQVRQFASTKDMLYSVPCLISCISRRVTLFPGDVIMTGTPGGVGKVVAGDIIEAGLGALAQIVFHVGNKTH
ncbi:putative Acylpyruvase FAHD1, mitochondrial [Hypsibius exemplaris]|uniref:oxaloacetate tautomerase n=1 Tax=Hypsibius exemplaris TaxID=2072580 RepID=A0A1W0WGW5_HYPEX|nr:putative Acylpyruvase FAHD1, mitochondrial [Hypsibius exemplaris]